MKKAGQILKNVLSVVSLLALAAVFFYSLFFTPAHSAPATPPDNPYDHAAVAQFFAPDNSGVIILIRGSFECASKHMGRAVNVNAAGSTWLGCWKMDGTSIHIDWEDGDHIDLDLRTGMPEHYHPEQTS